MGEKLKIHEVTAKILSDLQEQNYADYTVGRYRHCYNGLQKYMEGRGIEYYSANVGIDYIQHKYGISIQGLYGKHPTEMRSTIRGLQVLWDYSEYGTMVIKIRPGSRPFECPVPFTKEYEAFQEICMKRKYTRMGKTSVFSILRKFLIFLHDSGVASSDEITSRLITKFLSSYSGNSTRYIATIISVLRNYLSFLNQDGYMTVELTGCLPKVRVMRNAFIPSVWKPDDVKKLLNSVDRNNPTGKRDYAILLLVTRLGLRVSDIRSLKLTDLNWNRKLLSIVMQKTKQPLELPILDDVGWAIIDYLKNGRPQTVSDCVFICHKAPYDGFADNNNLSRMLGRHMHKTGIDRSGQKQGLHSLRSTLARVMLENGTPLPVISEALGHQNIQTTSIYLKIDMEGLRNCAIDPEEVFHGE
jgi:integrase/recombinase XerD